MIKAIYFYDGPIYMAVGKLNSEKGVKFTVIDAGMGTTYNLEQIKFYSASADINILTNNPWLLSFDFCDTFYLFDFKKEEYCPIMEFTNRGELRPVHNLNKMFVGGAFPDAKMIFSKPLS